MDARRLQSIRDEEHLRALSIVAYVLGGINAFFGLVPLIHVVLGTIMLSLPPQAGSPPRLLGLLLIAIGGAIIFVSETFAALKIYLGACLARNRHRVRCMVIAAVLCVAFPYGTALGVLTLIVLSRPSVRDRFDAEPVLPAEPAPAPGV